MAVLFYVWIIFLCVYAYVCRNLSLSVIHTLERRLLYLGYYRMSFHGSADNLTNVLILFCWIYPRKETSFTAAGSCSNLTIQLEKKLDPCLTQSQKLTEWIKNNSFRTWNYKILRKTRKKTHWPVLAMIFLIQQNIVRRANVSNQVR